MLTCLDHIAVFVEDLAAATRTYAMLLGRSPAWRGEHPGQGTANSIFRLRNASLELIGPCDDPAAARPDAPGTPSAAFRERLAARGEGIAFLAFGTDDLEEARAECAAHGLETEEPVAGLAHDADSGAFRRYRTAAIPLDRTRGIPLLLVEHQSPDALLQPGPLVGREEAAAALLDHVVVMTSEPERAIELYRDQLGIRLALDRSFEHRGVRLLFFRLGGATVEVGSSLTRPDDREAPQSDRLFGAAYRVDDVAAAHARLLESDIAVTGLRDGHKAGTRVFTIKGETHNVPTLIIGDG